MSASWVRRSVSKVELKRHIVKRVHYRMVSSSVGCSLHEHDNLGELVSAGRDIYHGQLGLSSHLNALLTP